MSVWCTDGKALFTVLVAVLENKYLVVTPVLALYLCAYVAAFL